MTAPTYTPHTPRDNYPPPMNPFGLPLGSVRGIMALLILGCVWIVVMWPGATAKLPLGHFFLLPLVFFSFALPSSMNPSQHKGYSILPVVLRILFVGGTLAVGFYAYQRGADIYQDRLTPNYPEFQAYWLSFAATLAGGFMAGHIFRLLFGPTSGIFVSIRAWLGVLSLVMLAGELALLVMLLSSKGGDGAFTEFLRFYQFIEVAVVASYFGSRL